MINEIGLPHNFNVRNYQAPEFDTLLDGEINRFIDVWHRRAGKDTTWWNITIQAASREVGTYLYLLPTRTQSREVIWEGIGKDGQRFIDYIPKELIAGVPNNTDMRIKLINGSVIKLGGSDYYNSLMGTNPKGIVFSEYSLQNPLAWHYLRPILTENQGWAAFVYTFRGLNHGYKLYETNKANKDWHVRLLSVKDTKRIDGTPVISEEMIATERRAGMSENMIQQEFYCVPLAAEGAYFAKELLQAERENRICDYAIDTTIPVDTYWDLGFSDAMAIWFVQRFRNEYRVIGYYENNFNALNHYLNKVHEFISTHGLVGGRHFAPHDINKRELSTGKSLFDIARQAGFRFQVVPRIKQKNQAIEAARAVFSRVYFHKTNCEQGLACLREYHANYNERLLTFTGPCDNWASHGADAFMQLAQSDDMAMSVSTGYNVRQKAVNQASLFR